MHVRKTIIKQIPHNILYQGAQPNPELTVLIAQNTNCNGPNNIQHRPSATTHSMTLNAHDMLVSIP